jgi:hypothetical protein
MDCKDKNQHLIDGIKANQGTNSKKKIKTDLKLKIRVLNLEKY